MKPGLHFDYDEATYHADPALSYSQCKVILDNPARFKWEQSNPRKERREFDFGHAAHAKILGVGMELAVIPDDILAKNGAASTSDAKAFIAEARASGKVPIKSAEALVIDAMAEAILQNDLARDIFERDGNAEVSMWWVDPRTGIECRGRIDWLTSTSDTAVIGDYKTTESANPVTFGRLAHRFRYPIQAYSYGLGYQTITGESDPPPYYLIAQEKEAPYSVAVYRVGDAELEVGRSLYEEALDTYLRCTENDTWPHPYGHNALPLQLPEYAYRKAA